MGGSGGKRTEGDSCRPQLQIWDDAAREAVLGPFEDGDERWDVLVVLEPVSGDLVRGRLSFRRQDQRYDTAPVLIEETMEAVIRRAGELPKSMLRQLFLSARG